MKTPRTQGFTLSELLIALAIMGLIATFTIPKIVTVAQNSDYKTRVQMAAALMVGAYNKYQLENTVTGTFKAADLTPYLNYTQFINNNSLTVDGKQNLVQSWTCNVNDPCVRLANGSVIVFFRGTIGSVGTSNAIIFYRGPGWQSDRRYHHRPRTGG